MTIHVYRIVSPSFRYLYLPTGAEYPVNAQLTAIHPTARVFADRAAVVAGINYEEEPLNWLYSETPLTHLDHNAYSAVPKTGLPEGTDKHLVTSFTISVIDYRDTNYAEHQRETTLEEDTAMNVAGSMAIMDRTLTRQASMLEGLRDSLPDTDTAGRAARDVQIAAAKADAATNETNRNGHFPLVAETCIARALIRGLGPVHEFEFPNYHLTAIANAKAIVRTIEGLRPTPDIDRKEALQAEVVRLLRADEALEANVYDSLARRNPAGDAAPTAQESNKRLVPRGWKVVETFGKAVPEGSRNPSSKTILAAVVVQKAVANVDGA